MAGKEIVKRIDELCERQKISRLQLSKDIGEEDLNMTNWKARDTIPRADVAIKIAHCLGVSVEYLINGEDTKNDKLRGLMVDLQNMEEGKLQQVINFVQFLKQ